MLAAEPPHMPANIATVRRASRWLSGRYIFYKKQDIKSQEARQLTALSCFLLLSSARGGGLVSYKRLSLLQKIMIPVFILHFVNLSAQVAHKDSILIQIKKYHETLNAEYADPATSPLDSADLARFSALNIYPPDLDFYFVASFKKTKKEKKFKMKTSTDRLPLYRKYGEVYIQIKGDLFKLNIYQNIELIKKKAFKNYLFLPFTDLTNGETTYGGGRYIDLEIPEGNELLIDFNKAYNPYCAYTHRYSCPIPPAENYLNIKIEAGVKEGLIYK